MSQSQRKRKSKVLSQSTSKTRNIEENETHNWTLQELENKCVRFFLTKMHTNIAIKRNDIVQHVFHERPGKNFDIVLAKAKKTLKNVYGLDVDIVDSDTTTKKYFVSNCSPYAHLIPNTKESDMKSVITFLVLMHIFMSQDNSTDTQLWQFLKEFDVSPETIMEGVGNIKNFIMQTLVKQNYIVLEDRGGQHENEEPKKCYKWGARAEETVSKMEILKFGSKVLATPDVKFWTEQHKDASQQFAGINSQ